VSAALENALPGTVREDWTMPDHVSVEISMLQETAGRLGQVSAAIAGVTLRVVDASAVGEAGLENALSAFVGAWRQEQERLTTSITRSKTVAATAADAYRRLDQAMASEADSVGSAEPVP
jgi:hypothetical protein